MWQRNSAYATPPRKPCIMGGCLKTFLPCLFRGIIDMLRRLRRSFGSSRGMVLFSLLAVTCCSCAAGPQSPLTLSVDKSSAGQLIPDDFSGVSYETKMLLNSHGQHYFSPDNRRLISMFYA